MMYKDLINSIIATDDSLIGFILRITLGIVLFPHTTQKMFGWFNGPGLAGEMSFMTTQAGLSVFTAIVAITIECLGTFMLLTGTATRIASAGIFGLFVGMIATWHYRNGFFMNWFGKLPSGKEGFEYHLLVLGMCIAIFIAGGGRYSIDKWITGR
ncbi:MULTISPECIES: DoxX family protein [Niastella]|uniref:DoxX family protein n=1 Tax=Niastella soli TaxID=2821487 RepID=A0ABS3YYZ2_9BACT|nr:DoxX family protein [Niastella soli]MBO9203049.1 DoxX family protein [Niastella soli]